MEGEESKEEEEYEPPVFIMIGEVDKEIYKSVCCSGHNILLKKRIDPSGKMNSMF